MLSDFWRTPRRKFILALILSSLVAEALFSFGAVKYHSLDFDYLSWNLLLAWVPLLLSIRLTVVLRRKLWSSWEALGLSLLWLVFLPNSFYMISDYIHLKDVSQTSVLYYALTLTAFIYTGAALGFSSLFIVHLHLERRLKYRAAGWWSAIILFICSVAVYFGRDLRWNSWDVLTNPGGLLFDISDRLQHLGQYSQMLIDVGALFILLWALYYVAWRATHLVQKAAGA